MVVSSEAAPELEKVEAVAATLLELSDVEVAVVSSACLRRWKEVAIRSIALVLVDRISIANKFLGGSLDHIGGFV